MDEICVPHLKLFCLSCLVNDFNFFTDMTDEEYPRPLTPGQSLLKSFVKEFDKVSVSTNEHINSSNSKDEEKMQFLSSSNDRFAMPSTDSAITNLHHSLSIDKTDTLSTFNTETNVEETRVFNFQRWCRVGQIFLFHKDNAKPCPTHLRVNKAGTHIFAATAFNKEPIAIRRIKKIVIANMIYDKNDTNSHCAPRSKYWDKADPNVCFSIVSDSTTYHLEAMTKEIRDLWIKGLNQFIVDQIQL